LTTLKVLATGTDGATTAVETTAAKSQVSERIGQRLQDLTVADVMHQQLFSVGTEQTLRVVAETNRGVAE
jgi:hypothetical protein